MKHFKKIRNLKPYSKAVRIKQFKLIFSVGTIIWWHHSVSCQGTLLLTKVVARLNSTARHYNPKSNTAIIAKITQQKTKTKAIYFGHLQSRSYHDGDSHIVVIKLDYLLCNNNFRSLNGVNMTHLMLFYDKHTEIM